MASIDTIIDSIIIIIISVFFSAVLCFTLSTIYGELKLGPIRKEIAQIISSRTPLTP